MSGGQDQREVPVVEIRADHSPSAEQAPEYASENQWHIAWRQFQKRRSAVWGVRGTKLLVVIAIFCPLVCSGLPLVWNPPGGETSFPLFERIFDIRYWENAVDRFFNLVLVLMLLWGLARLGMKIAEIPRGSATYGRIRRHFVGWGAALALLQAFGIGFLNTSSEYLDYRATAAKWPAQAEEATNKAEGLAERLASSNLGPEATVEAWKFKVKTETPPGQPLPEATPEVLAAFNEAQTREWLGRKEQSLREQAAAFAEADSVFTLIPYGHREQAEGGAADKHRSPLDFSDGRRHVLGTDALGGDVFARLVYGTRISLTVGLLAVSVYVLIGIIMGALAGYLGGKVDLLVMRLVEILICVPGLFLILTIIALFDERSIFMIMFAIGIVGWTGIARLIRGEFIRERGKEYVQAAKSLGLGTRRIVFRHILPNAVAPVIVAATFGVAGAIVVESTLSFLGLGDTNVPSWGQMLDEGRKTREWHLILCPGIAIFITVTLLNLVGDGLRDALDPKLRK